MALMAAGGDTAVAEAGTLAAAVIVQEMVFQKLYILLGGEDGFYAVEEVAAVVVVLAGAGFAVLACLLAAFVAQIVDGGLLLLGEFNAGECGAFAHIRARLAVAYGIAVGGSALRVFAVRCCAVGGGGILSYAGESETGGHESGEDKFFHAVLLDGCIGCEPDIR